MKRIDYKEENVRDLIRSGFLIELYTDHLLLEKGLSSNSVQAYLGDVHGFIFFLIRRGIDDIAKVDRETVLEYIYFLKDEELSARSIKRKLSSLRGYFSFLVSESRISINPTDLIDFPNTWKKLPATLSIQEAFSLMESAGGDDTASIRDRAMLELMYSTGMRVSELTNLKLADLHLESNTVRVMGKGSKERVVPVGDKAVSALTDYLTSTRPLLETEESEGCVFLNMRGKPLSRMGIWKILRKYLVHCGLAGKASPHTLRHSCASHLLMGGADLRVVQEILGHSDISTTQIYLHTSRHALKEIHRKYHPRG
ncbi:MAG: site-specific tyrosine recombinase XerD [Candidatus Glassbacteria bacterium]